MRLYQTQNLLDIQTGTTTVTAPDPKHADYAVTNLISNLRSRSSGNDLSPLKAPAMPSVMIGETASYRSCYKTTDAQLAALDHKLKIEFDLGDSFFQHCVVLIQDLYGGQPHEHSNLNEYFQNYEIYIGDDATYTNNPKCAGGPFMKTSDDSNYSTVSYVDNTIPHDNVKVWNYGRENWCNLQGRYTMIVADLSHLSGNYEMSLCNVAIMGTKYKPKLANPTKANVKTNSSKVLNMRKVVADLAIGNDLDIKFRFKPGSELDWVTIGSSCATDSCAITLDASGLPQGSTYELHLEQYDANSGGVDSTLYSETVKIKICADEC